jgi:hypothetical protein
MTAFEAGFLTYANEYGLSDNQAAHILKRAMDYGSANQMFKSFPEEDIQTPETMTVLANIMKHELLNNSMRAEKRKIML